MAEDKDIQTQDQAYQVQGYCAVVDDNMGCSNCVGCSKIGMRKGNIPLNTISSVKICKDKAFLYFCGNY